MFRIARLAAESMMKFTSKMPLVLLYLLTGALVVYSMGLAFTSNFNMGNLMVWLLTAGVTAYAIWHKPLHAWLHAPGLGRVVWWILVAAGICYALLIGFVAVSGYANPPTGQEKVMIVLGAGLRRDRPSTLLRYRLDKAYAYAAAHPDVLIITSGGQGTRRVGAGRAGHAGLSDWKGIGPRTDCCGKCLHLHGRKFCLFTGNSPRERI